MWLHEVSMLFWTVYNNWGINLLMIHLGKEGFVEV